MDCGATASYRCSLAEVLASREARQARQRRLMAGYGRPILSLSMVSPGEIKTSEFIRTAAIAGAEAASRQLAVASWPVLHQRRYFKLTGPEAVWVVDTAPDRLKRLMVELEDGHPLGRIWDLDVVGLDGRPLSRVQFGLPARRCLVCEGAAADCARSRRHPLPVLQQRIGEMARAWRRVAHD